MAANLANLAGLAARRPPLSCWIARDQRQAEVTVMLSQRHSHDDDHPNDSIGNPMNPPAAAIVVGEAPTIAATIPRMRPATLPSIAAPKTLRQIINHQTLIVRGKVGLSSCIVTPRQLLRCSSITANLALRLPCVVSAVGPVGRALHSDGPASPKNLAPVRFLEPAAVDVARPANGLFLVAMLRLLRTGWSS